MLKTLKSLTVERDGTKVEVTKVELAMLLATALGFGWMFKKGINDKLS